MLPDIDTGQQLEANTEYELEAVVDLPEGGESRYAVDIKLVSCWFNLNLKGGITGSSEGPAAFQWDEESGELDIELQSSIIYAGTNENPIGAGASIPSWNGENGSFAVNAASATNFATGMSALWFANDPSVDCPGCGGEIAIDEVSEEVISGNFEVTIYTIGEDRDDPPPPTIAEANFRAALSITSDPFDAYNACVEEWVEN